MTCNNILITGGAGFIGSTIALKLIGQGCNVTVLDSLTEQIHGKNSDNSELYNRIKGKVNFIRGTVTSRQDWQKALAGQDAVIHLAAETGTGQSMYEIYKYCNTNICGTALLLDILANDKHSVKKVIVADSKTQEAIDALQVLGYTKKDVEKALEQIDTAELKVEDIIKKALRELSIR